MTGVAAAGAGTARTDPSRPRRLRHIAFYLPQYHPVPENDEWWGPGFTEWTNVARARPLFRGHHQPHLPADLGFYDLRVPETRAAQAELAAGHGIDAFCYYHYWFGGRRILERPFDDVLRSGEPRFPFLLCWANENWTRVWNGGESEVLLEQAYSADDDRQHIRRLAEAFSDDRYVRVDGKPVFLVYRVSRLPDPARTAETWRREAERLGIGELYLCSVQSFVPDRVDPGTIGFDAAVAFAPDWVDVAPLGSSFLRRAARRALRPNSAYRKHRIHDYADLVERSLRAEAPSYKLYPCVSPGFDNSARRPLGGAKIAINATPAAYERWLGETIRRFEPFSPDENLLFVNAWNEWAEGNHLEPCARWGRAYLEAHARASAERPVADAGA